MVGAGRPFKKEIMAKERTVEEIHIQIGDVRYTLTGGSFAEMVEKVKAVPGRRFRAIPNDKHWVLPVTLEAAEVALSPYLLTAVGKALKVAIMDPTNMPTSPDEALPLLQENHALLEKIIQDLRDAAFLLNRNPSHLGGEEKKLIMRSARALVGWKG